MKNPAVNEIFHLVKGRDGSYISVGYWAKCKASLDFDIFTPHGKCRSAHHLRLVSSRAEWEEAGAS